MIRSIFKMMWKRRKSNRLMLAEMLISFVLLFALSSTVMKILDNRRIPLGFEYKNVWVLFMDASQDQGLNENIDTAVNRDMINLLVKNIKTMPEVVTVTANQYNIPYSGMYRSDVKNGDRICRNVVYAATDASYPDVMGLRMQEGRWFNSGDAGQKEIPVVINSSLKEALFGKEPAINQKIQSGLYKVTGVVQYFKINGEYAENTPAFFMMMKPEEMPSQLIIKTTPEAGESFRIEIGRAHV